VVDFNQAAIRLLGRGAQPTLGSTLAALLPGLNLPQALAGEVERHVTGHDGQARYLRVDAAALRHSHAALAGNIVTLRDISAERAAETALLEVQQRLQSANAELQRMALTDVLTGLANRRMLVARLDEEIARSRRAGSTLALLLIDVDHFKLVNDKRGHLAGDAVLGAIGECLRSVKRSTDVAARYGGEEFVLLLPHTPLDGALSLAERLRYLIEKSPYRAVDAEDSLTVSLGVAVFEPRMREPADLLEAADQALYRSKREGRNRVSVATSE